MAEAAITYAFQRCCLRNQVMVPFHAIRREIGKPCKIACRGVTDGQRAAVLAFVIGRIGASPIIAVFRYARAIIGPATGIGAAFKSCNPQLQFFACVTCHAEVEPLREFRILVLTDA